MIRIGNAPTSWGIEQAADPSYPSWSSVLDDVAAAGYAGTELGPLGFFPTDAGLLGDELDRRGLTLSGGNIMAPLQHRSEADAVLGRSVAVCDVLQRLGAKLFVIIDGIDSEREATAGRSRDAPRLGELGWSALVDTVRRVAEAARERDIVPVFHPHAGTHVEFRDEIERLLDATDPELLGLCVDTGHAAYAGIDPVELLVSHGDRLRYVHLKDVDPVALQAARQRRLGFWSAYETGVFCVLGRGAVDFEGVRTALGDLAYEGWLTVEQDASPAGTSVPLDDAIDSLSYLRCVGLAD